MLASEINQRPRAAKVAGSIQNHFAHLHSNRRTLTDSPACKVVHDSANERLKLLGARPGQLSGLPPFQDTVGLGKVTAYAREGTRQQWESLGFRLEGRIKGFFRDGTEATLWAAYLQPQRGQEQGRQDHEACLAVAQSKSKIARVQLPAGYTSHVVKPEEGPIVAALMRSIFPVYPTPLTDDAIGQLIRSGSNLFRCVCDEKGDMVAVASAELDLLRLNAEMTDCATRPDQRGRGFMAFLLRSLEDDVFRKHKIADYYSLARAQETGMNCVFRKLGYSYQGRLVNNCRMPSGWESMHIWCKRYSGA